jgi:Glucoamylase and related glycosyl hydrolases
MFSPELGRFHRMVTVSHDGDVSVDSTIDVSLAGLWLFGMFSPDDPKIVSTMDAVIGRLTVKTPIGGVARYENDYYFQVSHDLANVAGNPWILCTLSVAHWYAIRAVDAATLQKAIDLLQWTVDRAMPSGVLSEQVDPYTGAPISVAPLTWSHAAYVLAVHRVAERMKELGLQPAAPAVTEAAG